MPDASSPADIFRSAPAQPLAPRRNGRATRRVLGIDPGYDRCGYAVLSCSAQGRDVELLGSGTLRTSRSLPLPQRLHALGQSIAAVLAQWQPDEVAVEQLYFNRNVKTVIEVSQARGVILERAAGAGVQVAEYTPTQVKSQLTGNGQALKSQVAFMVCRLLGMKQGAKLDDEMDAIAIALCHGMRMSIPEILSPSGGRPDGLPARRSGARASEAGPVAHRDREADSAPVVSGAVARPAELSSAQGETERSVAKLGGKI